ncbi:MAG: hypothetical protein O2887_11810 [Bacteroidetes bacterium]|nr:hypothetical protein [Bacteroidota bacterium]MDA1121157.1 hypothetical protein [Bacteroidota bacterium]
MSASREIEIIDRILAKWDVVSFDKKAIVALDGYIDKIQHPVQSQNETGSIYYPTLKSFAERVDAASGVSAQVELFTQQIKPGGNAPIMANALACLGIKNTCIGTLGYPDVDPIFKEIHPDCEMITVGKAAETNALEFEDGKLILSELSTFTDLNWQKVKDSIDLQDIIKKAGKAQLIALVDWCNLPHATDIWRGFLDDVIRPHNLSKPHFFFDLTDPTKKSDLEIEEILHLIDSFNEFGTVTLGLNENEATKLQKALCRFAGLAADENELTGIGQFIFNHLSIDFLVIHPIDSSYSFTSGKSFKLEGRVIKNPKVSTGGGDNFNAGLYLGLLNKFSIEESMILAMATSGAYVLHGFSPNIDDLKSYLHLWKSELD